MQLNCFYFLRGLTCISLKISKKLYQVSDSYFTYRYKMYFLQFKSSKCIHSHNSTIHVYMNARQNSALDNIVTTPRCLFEASTQWAMTHQSKLPFNTAVYCIYVRILFHISRDLKQVSIWNFHILYSVCVWMWCHSLE